MTHSKIKGKSISDETHVLTLSFIEMHFIMKAMEQYNRHAYSLTKNDRHAEGVEKLHDELTKAYIKD